MIATKKAYQFNGKPQTIDLFVDSLKPGYKPWFSDMHGVVG